MNNPTPVLETLPRVPTEHSQQAFERHRDAIMAVPREALCATNVEINDAVAIVVGAMPQIERMREALIGLALTPAWCVERLESLAYAAWFANVRANSSERQNDVTRFLGVLREMRPRVKPVIDVLVAYGELPLEARLPENAPRGYQDLAVEMSVAAERLGQVGAVMERLTPMRQPEVVQVGNAAAGLVGRLRRKPLLASTGEDLGVTRWQAFTLLEQAWGEVRRGVQYVRWHQGDAEMIAPALRRKGRRAK